MLEALGVRAEDQDGPDSHEMEQSMREHRVIMTDPVSRPDSMPMPES